MEEKSTKKVESQITILQVIGVWLTILGNHYYGFALFLHPFDIGDTGFSLS